MKGITKPPTRGGVVLRDSRGGKSLPTSRKEKVTVEKSQKSSKRDPRIGGGRLSFPGGDKILQVGGNSRNEGKTKKGNFKEPEVLMMGDH